MCLFCLFIASMASIVWSYNLPTPKSVQSIDPQKIHNRKSFLNKFGKTLSGIVVTSFLANPMIASASSQDKLTDVYFGVGCFWHIQHEFVEAERELLKRSNLELSSLAGYAGGSKTGNDGEVCYHNMMRQADYGKLGHGEVVGLKIPESSIGDFAKVYFSLFSPKGQRVDPMDRGPEYRSLIGLPGGIDHPMYLAVNEAATTKNFQLVVGKGNDGDTLGTNKVWVYDSNKFPFYQGEVYHQFHDDFQSPPYGKDYNNLIKLAYDDGRVKSSGCPDRQI